MLPLRTSAFCAMCTGAIPGLPAPAGAAEQIVAHEEAAAAQAAGCSLAGDQLNEGCGWVATLGAVMIAIPSIYEFLVVVLFTAALCGIKNEAESGGGVPMSGIVMNKQ